MKTFSFVYNELNWDELKQKIYSKTEADVVRALLSHKRNIDDFMALVSPAAERYTEHMKHISNKLTQQRFGKIIQLYIPLYLSNYCVNSCVYCGFNRNNNIKRITLTYDEIEKECKIIKEQGFDNILLVSGESSEKTNFSYLLNALSIARKYFSAVSMEVQPLNTTQYKELVKAGLYGVYVYQETYNKEKYKIYHQDCLKADFYYRLETPDRLGEANINKIGLGFLIGLDDWRTESVFMALHLKYLEKKYWKTRYSVSFPRLRPYGNIFQPKVNITEKELTQLITAFRLFNTEIEITISTRESPEFRDNSIKIGVTNLSAGSKTNPGGYTMTCETDNQFDVHDNRSPKEIADKIKSLGYEVVWKDWFMFQIN
jgi:2-iminoacetate synthase